MLDIIADTLLDSLKLVPFLFVAFLIIEVIEHKLQDKTREIVSKSGKFGPFIGSGLGLLPQCGFSVVATNLYVTRIISLGTLIAIYLSTSDEMLPILLSEQASLKLIFGVLAVKFVVGMVAGYGIDLFCRKNKRKEEPVIYDICEDEHCGCEHGHSLIKSSIIHTLKTFLFLVFVVFILNVVFEYFGEHYLSKLFLKDTFLAPFLSSLIGLIPNCGASIMITELYLNGALGFGALCAGLLTGSGVAILVLFKSNKDLKDNLKVLGLIYGIGVAVGILIEIIEMIF